MPDSPDFEPDRRSTVVTEQSVRRFRDAKVVGAGVTSGSDVEFNIRPNDNEVLTLTSVLFQTGRTGGSGDQTLTVKPTTITGRGTITVAQPGTERLLFEGLAVPNRQTATTISPSDPSVLAQSVKTIRAVKSDPITFEYANDTGAFQSNSVELIVSGIARRTA
jgi:hypothetical protein